MTLSEEYALRAKANKSDAERSLFLAKYYSDEGQCAKFELQMKKFKRYTTLQTMYEDLSKEAKKEEDDRKSN